jgi:hypothetical protein
MDMFEQDELVIYHHPVEDSSTNQTYGEVVKDLIMDEKQYLRDLQVNLQNYKKRVLVQNKSNLLLKKIIFCNT